MAPWNVLLKILHEALSCFRMKKNTIRISSIYSGRREESQHEYSWTRNWVNLLDEWKWKICLDLSTDAEQRFFLIMLNLCIIYNQ